MRSALQRIEDSLQNLVERLSGTFASPDRASLMAQRILDALRDYLEQQDTDHAPGIYTIFMHPQDLGLMPPGDPWSERVSIALVEVAAEIGLQFSEPPLVRFAPDTSIQPGGLEIVAEGNGRAIGSTAVYRHKEIQAAGLPLPADLRAYLILEGQNIFALDRLVYNLGRRKENDLVIDDLRVSRNHAQLRFSNGRYLLFDLNSTGGTFVNQLRVSQHTLIPGDVISLAGYSLIFGQDKPVGSTGPSEGGTAEIQAGGKDGPA
mgnify:FL=1